jgi:hypothetical protein
VKKLELPDGEAGDLAREYVGWWETDVEGKMLPALDHLRAANNANDQRALQETNRRIDDIEFTDTYSLERRLGIVNCFG